jgi:predicted GNAT family acetyltransferase
MRRDIRPIDADDIGSLRSFLDLHPDTTLFLRSNLAEAGLHDALHPFGGKWVGAFEGAALAAVAAHFNGGNVVVAGRPGIEEAARLAVRLSARPVRGVIGPWRDACAAREALALHDDPVLESREVLYRLELDRLVLPESMTSGRVRCRRSSGSELDSLVAWRVAFEIESLAKEPSSALSAAAFESINRAHEMERLYVLEDGEAAAVASSAFNAWADGIVQVGGVFTPPELRGRGHGRAVVAGSLLDASARGAHRAVLFTREENRAAQRAYAALGFEHVGDYGLLLY